MASGHSSIAVELARIRRVLELDRLVERIARRRLEGASESEALVQGDAQGVDVGPTVELDAAGHELLRTHVRWRTEEVSGQLLV